jgi:hypothetical protein
MEINPQLIKKQLLLQTVGKNFSTVKMKKMGLTDSGEKHCTWFLILKRI